MVRRNYAHSIYVLSIDPVGDCVRKSAHVRSYVEKKVDGRTAGNKMHHLK